MIDEVPVTEETHCQHDDVFAPRVTRIRTDTLSPEVPARNLRGFSHVFFRSRSSSSMVRAVDF
jgi:hypothetical protein